MAHADAHDRMPGPLEGGHVLVLVEVRAGLEAQVDEEPIGAVDGGVAGRLAVHGHDSPALLPRGLGEELLEPGAEVVDARRGDQRHLVTAAPGEHAHHDAERRAGIVGHGHRGGARHCHLRGPAQKVFHVESHDGARHHAEIRQRRIAATHRRHTEVDVPELGSLRDLVQLRARIGDRDEVAPRALLTHRPPDAIEEVVLEDVRLERGAGLARHDEEGLGRVQASLHRADLSGIRRVQHVQLGKARDPAEGHPQHLGAEARAAHPQEQDMVEAPRARVFLGPLEMIELRDLLLGDPEPAEPRGLVRARPQRGVALPEAAHLARLLPGLDLSLDGRLEVGGQCPRLALHVPQRIGHVRPSGFSNCLRTKPAAPLMPRPAPPPHARHPIAAPEDRGRP